MADLIRRYPLISYFVIAYAGTWLVWALFVLSREGSGLLPFHSPSSFLVLIGIGTFSGPTVSAFVVTAITEGMEGIVRLLRRIVQWRVGLAWYLFTFVGLPAIETLGTIAIPGALASATPIDVLPVLWAFWHAPIWFSGQWSVPSAPNIAVYVFWIVAVTFIFTWVFNNTQGSVFMAILLHGTMDVFPNAFLLAHLPGAAEMTSASVLSMYWGLALGFGLFALLLVIAARGRLGKPA